MFKGPFRRFRTAISPLSVAIALASGVAVSTAAQAQEGPRRGTEALLEEVTVTARKREIGHST